MRMIKFRAKALVNNEWVYGDLLWRLLLPYGK